MVGGRGGEGLGVDGEGRVPALSLCTSCPGGPGGPQDSGLPLLRRGCAGHPICDSQGASVLSPLNQGFGRLPLRAEPMSLPCPPRAGDPESLMIQIGRAPQLMIKPLPRRHTHTLEPQVKAFLCQESSNPPC